MIAGFAVKQLHCIYQCTCRPTCLCKAMKTFWKHLVMTMYMYINRHFIIFKFLFLIPHHDITKHLSNLCEFCLSSKYKFISYSAVATYNVSYQKIFHFMHLINDVIVSINSAVAEWFKSLN